MPLDVLGRTRVTMVGKISVFFIGHILGLTVWVIPNPSLDWDSLL